MEIKTAHYQRGYEFTRGVLSAVGELVWRCFVVALFLILLYGISGWGLDGTDKNGFERSGMTLLKDYGTGQEYLYRDGCLIPRKEGKI